MTICWQQPTMSSVGDKNDNMKMNNVKFTQTYELDIMKMLGSRRHNSEVRPKLVSRIESGQSPLHAAPVQPIPDTRIDNALVCSLQKVTPLAKARIRSFLRSKTVLDQKAYTATPAVLAPNHSMTKNVQEMSVNSVFGPEQTLQNAVKEITEYISDSSDSTETKAQKVTSLAQASIRSFLRSKTVLDQKAYSATSAVKTEPADIDTSLPLLSDHGKVELVNSDISIDDRNSGECDANRWNDLMPDQSEMCVLSVNFATNVEVKAEPPKIDITSPILGDIAKVALTKDMMIDETDSYMCLTNQSADNKSVKLWKKKIQSKKDADFVKISKNQTKLKIAPENAQDSPTFPDAKNNTYYVIDKQGVKTKRIYLKHTCSNDNDSQTLTSETRTNSNQIIEKQNSSRNETEKLKEIPDLSKETFPLYMLSEGASDCNRYVKVANLKTCQSFAEKEEDFSKRGTDKYISTGNSQSICPNITSCRKPMDTPTQEVPTDMDGHPKTNELFLIPFTPDAERALQFKYEKDKLFYDSEGTDAKVDPIPLFLVPNKHYIKAPIKVHISDNCDSIEDVACVSLVDADFDRLKTNKNNDKVAEEPMTIEIMPPIHGDTVKVGLINDGMMVDETKSIISITNHGNVVLPDQGFAADIKVKTEPQMQSDLMETELVYDTLLDKKYLDQFNTMQANCLPSDHTFSTSSDSLSTVPMIKTESLKEGLSPQITYDHVEVELVNDDVMVGAASSDHRCDQSFEMDSDQKRTVKIKETESSSLSTNQQKPVCVQLDTKTAHVDISALDGANSNTHQENDLQLSDQSSDHRNSGDFSANCKINSIACNRKRKHDSFDGKENSVKKTKSDETLVEIKDVIDKPSGLYKTDLANKLIMDDSSIIIEKYDKFHNIVCNSLDHNYSLLSKVYDHKYPLGHCYKWSRIRNSDPRLSTIWHDHDYCVRHCYKWSVCIHSYLSKSSNSESSLSSSSNFKLSTDTDFSLSNNSNLPQPNTLKSLLPKNLKSLLSKSPNDLQK